MGLKVRAAALIIYLASVNCQQTTQPTPPVASSRDRSPGSFSLGPREAAPSRAWPDLHALPLETDVEVIPRRFVSGSPIEIVVTVRNISREPTFVTRCPLAYAWFDESGEYVGPFFACAMEPSYILLAPGEKLEKRFTQVGYWAPGRYKVYPYVGGLPFQHPFTVKIDSAANAAVGQDRPIASQVRSE